MLGETDRERKVRMNKLKELGKFPDRDLLNGRFARAATKKDEKTEKTEASSTRPSTGGSGGFRDRGEDQKEEALRQGLKKSLTLFFANPNDATLFLKVLIADGIDT